MHPVPANVQQENVLDFRFYLVNINDACGNVLNSSKHFVDDLRIYHSLCGIAYDFRILQKDTDAFFS